MTREPFRHDPQLGLAVALLIAITPAWIAWQIIHGRPWHQ